LFFVVGYGFVDFDSVEAAEAAVRALQAKGVQAQMAKVGIQLHRPLATVRVCCMSILFLINTITITIYLKYSLLLSFAHPLLPISALSAILLYSR